MVYYRNVRVPWMSTVCEKKQWKGKRNLKGKKSNSYLGDTVTAVSIQAYFLALKKKKMSLYITDISFLQGCGVRSNLRWVRGSRDVAFIVHRETKCHLFCWTSFFFSTFFVLLTWILMTKGTSLLLLHPWGVLVANHARTCARRPVLTSG